MRGEPELLFGGAAKKRCIEVAERTAEVLKSVMPRDTGEMIASVSVRENRRGADVTIGAPYWKWVNYGTGIYGPTGQRIYPKRASVLVFYIGGAKIVVPSIAGQRGQHFVERAKEIMVRIRLRRLHGGR
jgi:hypothetical protein